MAAFKLLWIEDDASQIFGLMSPLIRAGYKVDTVRDYEEAIKILSENKYDLIILDIIIPSGKVISSEEDLKAIEKDKYYGIKFLETDLGEIPPILVLTVINNPKVLHQIEQSPKVKRVLVKGMIKPSDLKVEVIKILKKSSS